jgi:hypothetical protein
MSGHTLEELRIILEGCSGSLPTGVWCPVRWCQCDGAASFRPHMACHMRLPLRLPLPELRS